MVFPMIKMTVTGIAIVLGSSMLAHADPVWPVRPEPRLTCMAVTVTGAQILEQPRPDATHIATAGSIVFAVLPRRLVNGFAAVERPNREIGWVPQNVLTDGPAACVPTLMSNGLVLTGTR
jgi:hypothetical protein